MQAPGALTPALSRGERETDDPLSPRERAGVGVATAVDRPRPHRERMTMPRTSPWPAAVVALAVVVFAFVGCHSGSTPPREAAPRGVGTSTPRSRPDDAKLFADWPKPA